MDFRAAIQKYHKQLGINTKLNRGTEISESEAVLVASILNKAVEDKTLDDFLELFNLVEKT